MLRFRTTALAVAVIALVPAAPSLIATANADTTPKAAKRVSLLSAQFEGAPTGRVSVSTFKSTLTGNSSTFALDDSSIVKEGANKTYRVSLDKGTVYGNPNGNNGMVNVIPLRRAVDNACIRYRIRFDPNFDFSLGGKLPGLSGVAPGVTPSLPSGGGKPGDKGWSGRLMWRTKNSLPSSVAGLAKPSMPVSYMYGPKQVDYYGDVVPWKVSFTPGAWQTVRQCYEMNTVGKADGKLQAWFNGKQVLNITNYVYRTRKDVQISHLMWSIFRGGSTMDWAGSRDNFVEFDGLRVSTRA